MDIKTILGQSVGALLTLLCIVTPQFKRKWQMASLSIISNMLSALNYLLLDEIGACGVAVVAVVQATTAIVHAQKNDAPKRAEICAFGLLYICGSLLPYFLSGTLSDFRFADVLPIFAALLFLGYLAQKDEQRMRWFLLGNATVFLIYNALIFSTQFFAQLITLVSVAVAMMRYRKQTKKHD